jgi:hypothetical protein
MAVVMLTKKSLSQLRLALLRVASPAPPRISTHVYEIRPRVDKHGIDLISDVLPYSPLWYAGPTAISNAISFAKFYSRSHDAVIRVYDEAGAP